MKNFIIITAALLIMLIQGCKTAAPVDTGGAGGTGKLIISSDIIGAEIFADGGSTGKFTPDTLVLSAGQHIIAVKAAGFSVISKTVTVQLNMILPVQMILSTKTVLLEDFSNVSCNPCKTSNEIIESLQKYSYGKTHLVIIKVPTFFPGSADPLYLAAKTECNTRISYYNIFAAPAVVIDGSDKPVATDSTAVKQKIESHLSQPQLFAIGVTDSISGGMLSTKITILCKDTSGVDFSNLYLRTAVTEETVEFPIPPGSNGETKFYNVLRAMLPDADGTAVGLMQPGQTKTFTLQCPLSSVWTPASLHTAAFLQDRTKKTVFQAAESE